MKGIGIGVNKAKMVDDNGELFTVKRDGCFWIVDGKAYKDPFEAFKAIERSANNGKGENN